MTKITFVAAPLTARSGVYRSARELVAAGHRHGQDWRLVVGVSEQASGERPKDDPHWVDEIVVNPAGLRGVARLRTLFGRHELVRSADMVISLIPQSDMALATLRMPWVAYVRGLPWPAPGESSSGKRLVWKTLERLALRRARAVWATTRVLSEQLAWPPGATIVPAGVEPLPRRFDGNEVAQTVVWAARFHRDKNPQLFMRAVEGQPFMARMYGSGELETELRKNSPSNTEIMGWVAAEDLWTDAFAYVGTSFREAFGRSALEAAMTGLPVVVSDVFGVADQIVTADEFRRRFVLPVNDLGRWQQALRDLHDDRELRTAYSDHLVMNAEKLTIDRSAESIIATIEHLLEDQRPR